jgi:cyclohexyl-isocyanide hydratase
MDRRQLIGSMLAACTAAAASRAVQAQHQAKGAAATAAADDHSRYHATLRETIVLIAYPGMTALDLLGPQHMFSSMMGAKVLIAAQTLEPVASDTGLKIVPDVDFATCPRDIDLFLVPGGTRGTTAALKNPRLVDFVRELGASSKYVTSVCTGSLILGMAGLLKGYQATSHWLVRHMLGQFGATSLDKRVVFDRNRITGAGVTAGMDMALAVVKMLRGEEYARLVALLAEYAPEPPVQAGTPAIAGEKSTTTLRDMYQGWLGETEAFVKENSDG